MRKIKFRVWNQFLSECGEAMTIKELNNPDPNIDILQYTGINDKNGKEIYERDIVKRSCPCGDCQNVWIGEIRYNNKTGMFIFNDREHKESTGIIMYEEKSGKAALLEVIGNIYENPELIVK